MRSKQKNHQMTKHRTIVGTLLAPLLLILALPCHGAEVNLYSARKEALIKPMLDQFSQQTGITVNLVTAKADALLKRLQLEGKNTPADLFLTVDVGRLYRAQVAGLLKPVTSARLDAAVPAAYRAAVHTWYGLSLRARIIVYAKDRLDRNSAPASYADLALPKWRGKLCVRSSNNIYNQSLVAALIAHQGVAPTETWARGLVANFARPPSGGDRDQIKAVAVGQCDIALVNSYYLAGMLRSAQDSERQAAQKVELVWPDQGDRGSHMNVSGAGIVRWTKHEKQAQQLLEFLLSDNAQSWYAETNHEFPIRAGIEVSKILNSWGEFKADKLNLSELGRLNADATRLMDRAGWR